MKLHNPEVIEEIRTIILEAGQRIMEVYNSDDFEEELKSDESPITKADKIANAYICQQLNEKYPHTIIISEENKKMPYSERTKAEWVWILDPVDGTKEFIKRNGEFSVNLALLKNNKLAFGAIYAPALGEYFFAIKNEGAYLIKNGERRKLRVDSFAMDKEVRIVVSRSHLNEDTQKYISRFSKHTQVPMGSGLKLAKIAEGKADIYPRFGPTMEWDIASGDLILQEAGGQVFQLDGKPLIYNKANFINPFFIATGNFEAETTSLLPA